MIKLRKKYKELNLIPKNTPKNTIFYTHYFTFSYIRYRQPQKVVIINWKCFEIMVKF